MKRVLFLCICYSITISGCNMMESGKSSMRRMTRMFRPNPHDGPMSQQDLEDEWGFVGTEGRGDQEREQDIDPWWQNLVMSPEARNIERNLGID